MVAIEDPSASIQVVLAMLAGLLALAAAAFFTKAVTDVRTDEGPHHKRAEDLRKLINEGAIAFLNTEYKYLAVFVVFMAVAVGAILSGEDDDELRGLWTAFSILVGAGLSAAAGYGGMLIATNANSRTMLACAGEGGMTAGLKVSFASGAVMSNTVVGLGIVGLSAMYLLFENSDTTSDPYVEWGYLSGFGFGASCIALFARVGGGVFTKAADVGADLVGKVEKGIPEDDPRNPAVIADNVGDNVGDVAGMGADLFESFVGSLIAAATLATDVSLPAGTTTVDVSAITAAIAARVALPFWIAGGGILVSLIGIALIRSSKLPDGTTLQDLLTVIRKGIFLSAFLSMVTSLIACLLLFESEEAWKLWGCTTVGLVAGEIIGKFTEYCTSYEDAPTRGIAASSKLDSAAPVVVKGLGVGMISVVVPTTVLATTIIICNELAGLYGISISAVGLLATLGITLATDAFGPVADNAGGLAEMSGQDDAVRDRTDALDSLGNTTAATGKGAAIGSAVLTSISLIAAFAQSTGLDSNKALTTITDANVLVGVLLGAMLPFLFAALTMLSVDRAAGAIMTEVRLQFYLCPQLLDGEFEGQMKGVDGKMYPDSNQCVAIATESAIQEMLLPGAMAVFSPIITGFLLGAPALLGLLVGSLASGFMLALTMSNAGGAWDNAKKWVEKCASDGEPTPEGGITYTNYGVKKAETALKVMEADITQLLAAGDVAPEDEEGRQALAAALTQLYKKRHEPVVVGDTVGDPFKDTSGPALNILIKLMSIVSLVLAPKMPTEAFDSDKWWVAVIIFAVVTAIVIFFLKRFEVTNDARKADAEAQRKQAKAALSGGAAAPVDDEADAGAGAAAAEAGAAVEAVEAAEEAVEAAAVKVEEAAPAETA